MPHRSSTRLLKVFRDSFTADDIYEPIRADNEIENLTVIRRETSFAELVKMLQKESILYVEQDDSILGFITRRSLESAPFRMWLFGIISLMEINVTDALRNFYPDESWKGQLTEGRLEAARLLQRDRAKGHQTVSLLECLSFTDKLRILLKDEVRRAGYGIASNKEAKWGISHIIALRNSLAHSHPIVSDNWEIITKLVPTLNSIVTGNPADDLKIS